MNVAEQGHLDILQRALALGLRFPEVKIIVPDFFR